MSKLRVVLDTNVIVSAVINPNGTPGKILAALNSGKLIVIMSRAIALEVLDVLNRPKIKQKYGLHERILEIEELITGDKTEVVMGDVAVVSLSDPDDEKILATAVEGNADYIVTGDKRDLLVLGTYEGIAIVTPGQFLSILNDRMSE